MRATLAMEMAVAKIRWTNAAACASNLSELELSLGEVAGAVGDAEQSVTYADHSGDAAMRVIMPTIHADALHQAGRRAEAEARFREAEEMQEKRQPEYSLLYSVQGFRYCDLLLTEAERAAWQTCVAANWRSPQTARTHADARAKEDGGERQFAATTLLESCRTVEQRAAQTLKWAEMGGQGPPLDIALDHLTLGRAALYRAILEKSEIRNQKAQIELAVSGLYRAGTTHHVPRGLLTRAWLRSLTGARTGPESGQSDLDEAWEIAERGPMPLFLADIHLHRARLFGTRNAEFGARNEGLPYPWVSPQADLAAARALIESCGYWRRKEELEDAEAAAKHW